MTLDDIREVLMKGEGTLEERLPLLKETLATTEEGAEFLAQFEEKASKTIYSQIMSAPKAERSDALVAYGYRELCLMLDSFYGLKEAHNISNFNHFFYETGLANGLTDPDAAKADSAIADLLFLWLEDGHSGFLTASYLAGSSPDTNLGFSLQNQQSQTDYAAAARQQYPEASLPYYEVGDTAYVTFDEFTVSRDNGKIPDYYGLAETGGLPDDTFGIIIKAHQQITRENSPIRNVVLDLSCNGGGAAPTAGYTICWFLGNGEISQHNTFTGAQSTMTYQADINLDGVYDEKDTLAGRGLNLYCLISPGSFSCGNLVPWAFKEDGSVTLLGKVSGGGSCVVQYMTTAWGTSFQISGSKRLSFLKNGAYYDVDQGVEPDFIIMSYENFYDRQALADYISRLF
jgi:hypothetical protein